ncbi:hypothetical protein KPSA1_01400 [Pseudomonas syringae pv. actinidiae]|uniref:Uncharacterized protein n=1 Tax=Pseudomonas syringae pv. actinidiae TaxID=103796 RepID=A0A2V0Q5N8_PSESF|nr:hypothetical protein KPSA1_01400 [Pseudomonas syringae pv. actinidiae]
MSDNPRLLSWQSSCRVLIYIVCFKIELLNSVGVMAVCDSVSGTLEPLKSFT